jgi:hypothetical protein
MSLHPRTATALLLLATLLTGCEQQKPAADNNATSATRTAATDAYVFGYPLLTMAASEAKMTNVPHAGLGVAPANQFGNMKAFPDASFTDVVSPNADTLYSLAWLNLASEPILLSVPDTHGRYYLMPMLDAWTNVFASPGKRTTGTTKGDYAITGPAWSGTLPANVKQIKAPTDLVWILGRTQTNGKADYPAVNAIQAQYKLTPLSAWGKPYTPPSDVPTNSSVDMKATPINVVASLDAQTYFSKLAALMKDNPPAPDDAPMIAKLATLGIVPGQPFDINKSGPDVAKAISDGVDDGRKRVIELGHNPGNARLVNGWMIIVKDIGTYGTNYNARAGVTWVGLGANLPEDAIYPVVRVDSDNQPLNGANKYVLHFDKGQTPPANAFWSVTMYNSKQLFVDNPINRYAIGDRDKLKYNPDGSLDLYIQHDSPAKDKVSNWLPADQGSFNMILRMYWPKPSVADGSWTPPSVKKTQP